MGRHQPVIIEQLFHQPIKTVWKAITEVGQMKQWFFENIPDFRSEVGFKTSFNVHANGKDFLHLWEIVEVIPQKKITYSWKYEGYDGKGSVIFELFKESSNNTLLRLTNLGLETFSDDMPEFTRESCESGWKYFINQRLGMYLSYEH